MIRMVLALTIGAMVAFAPAAYADDKVAGREALTTKSAKDLIAQREKWGTKPSKTYKD